MARKRIGELLLERGAITQAQLDEGLAAHRQSKQRLGVALVQKGFVREDQLAQVLSEALGIGMVDLRTTQPEWTAVHMLRARFCEQHDLFPFAIEASGGKKQLLVATSDPLNTPALKEIEFTTGLKVVPRLATVSAVRGAIARWYHKKSPDDLQIGKMTVVQAGGVTLTVDDEPTAPGEPEEVIVGEELAPEPTSRSLLAQQLKSKEQAARAKPRKSGAAASLSDDLDFLLGAKREPDQLESLERKFWALMRIMARKGLLTHEEFRAELDEDAES